MNYIFLIPMGPKTPGSRIVFRIVGKWVTDDDGELRFRHV